MIKLAITVLIALLAAGPLEAKGAFQDLDALDAQVAAHLGASVGQPGGASTPIDRRLRLQKCPGAVQVDIPSTRYATVRCEAIGWRIRVPISALANQAPMSATPAATNMARAAPAPQDGPPLILRNTQVQLVIENAAFSVTTLATALGQGGLGEEIRVRLSDSRTIRNARVTGPNQAMLID